MNDSYYIFAENIFSSLHHFNSYLEHVLFVYIFGGSFENHYDSTIVGEVFDSFKNRGRNKILKNLLINSTKKNCNDTLQSSNYDVRLDNCNYLEKQIVILSFRTLLEISTIQLNKDLKQLQCKRIRIL